MSRVAALSISLQGCLYKNHSVLKELLIKVNPDIFLRDTLNLLPTAGLINCNFALVLG